jgi:hypothetical protein
LYVLVLSRSSALTIQHVHLEEHSTRGIIVRVITHAKQASRFNVFHVQGNLPALDVITAHIVTLYTSEHKNSDVQSGEQHGHNTFAAGGGTDDALEERVRGGWAAEGV